MLGTSRAKRSKKTTSFSYQRPLTTQTTTRLQRRERNGPRLFGPGTEAFGFAAASSLGCRATHIPFSAPRFAISSSPPYRYYVLQSRIVVLSLCRLTIRSATQLRHLPFSTFQVSSLLPSCSEYLTRTAESRYTTRTTKKVSRNCPEFTRAALISLLSSMQPTAWAQVLSCRSQDDFLYALNVSRSLLSTSCCPSFITSANTATSEARTAPVRRRLAVQPN